MRYSFHSGPLSSKFMKALGLYWACEVGLSTFGLDFLGMGDCLIGNSCSPRNASEFIAKWGKLVVPALFLLSILKQVYGIKYASFPINFKRGAIGDYWRLYLVPRVSPILYASCAGAFMLYGLALTIILVRGLGKLDRFTISGSTIIECDQHKGQSH